MNCSSCQAQVAADAAFCSQCGQRLVKAPAPSSSHEGERRQITVLFCDLVGSTKLSTVLDADDMQYLLQAYHGMAGMVVNDHRGHVAQHLGDGILVYFGFPNVEEDDPVRAVSAGLSLIENMPRLSQQLSEEIPELASRSLRLRIGIDTGTVVVGQVGLTGAAERLAAGDAVNRAARLQTLADNDELLISDSCAQLVQGVYQLTDLGEKALRGFDVDTRVHRVDGALAVQSRFALASARGLTPFVDRREVIAALEDAWRHTTLGQGGMILLRGEAGIGKSRVAQILRQRLGAQSHGWLEIQCSSLHAQTALYPVIGLLRQILDPHSHGSLPHITAGLTERLAKLPSADSDGLKMLAELVATHTMDLKGLSADDGRRKLLDLLVQWLSSLAIERPVVLVVEDLHWADPSTLDLLGRVLSRVGELRLQVIATARPEFAPRWPDADLRVIEMQTIKGDDLDHLLEGMDGVERLSDQIRSEIAARSDGVPFYAEELARAWLMGAHVGIDTIPSSLRDLLAARIGRLGPDRELAQLGAVLGREFPKTLLARIGKWSTTDLNNGLERLVQAQILHRRGTAQQPEFRFHHALLQDSAYYSMVKRRRRDVHRQVAEALQMDGVSEQPGLLAYHFDKAEDIAQAVHHYALSGQREITLNANEEAIAQYRRALVLLPQLPKNERRDAQEIDLLLGLATPLSTSLGFSAEEVGATYQSALDICRRNSLRSDRLFEALFGLARHFQTRGDLDRSASLCAELLKYADSTGEQLHALAAATTLGQLTYWQGRFVEARDYSLRAVALTEQVGAGDLWQKLGVDPGVYASVFGSWALWALGEPDQAVELAEYGENRADQLDHPYSQAYICAYSSILGIMLRAPSRAGHWAGRTLELCERFEFPIPGAQATVTNGWVRLVEHHDPASGMAGIGGGIERLKQAGTGVGAAGFLAVLSEALISLGKVPDALPLLDMGLQMGEATGQQFYKSELLRLKATGVLAARPEATVEALELLQAALAVAQQQQARSLALRVANTLARLLIKLDRADEAVELLKEEWAAFDPEQHGIEFDEIRALLKELA